MECPSAGFTWSSVSSPRAGCCCPPRAPPAPSQSWTHTHNQGRIQNSESPPGLKMLEIYLENNPTLVNSFLSFLQIQIFLKKIPVISFYDLHCRREAWFLSSSKMISSL